MLVKKEIEVRYQETDQMGIVYHANYLVWFDLGRTEFLKQLGYSVADLEKENLLFAVRKISVEYLKACRFGETIVVETSVKDFSPLITTYKHTVINTNGEIKAKGESTVICIDKSTFRILRLDRAHPLIYGIYHKLFTQNQKS